MSAGKGLEQVLGGLLGVAFVVFVAVFAARVAWVVAGRVVGLPELPTICVGGES